MAILNKRPKIRDYEIEVVESGTKRKLKTPDLNDVLRGILVDLRNAWGMSTRQLAFRLGLRQQTLSAFLDLDADQGTRMETLSAVCGALDMSASELFDLHPQYGKDAGDRRWQMLRNSISPEAVDQLVETAMLGAQIGTIDKLIANQLEMVRAIGEAQGIDVASVKSEAKKISKAV
tara:strand:- start:1239 stop:1766 length:528 start_codon:yes stop_codon:yes gene_type:complete